MKATSSLAALCGLMALSAALTTPAIAAETAAQKGAKLYGDANRGSTVFSMWCAACHSTTPKADDRIPTAQQLATDRGRTDGIIRTFLMQPHKPMPPLELSNQQIEDILAYLHRLKAIPTGK